MFHQTSDSLFWQETGVVREIS